MLEKRQGFKIACPEEVAYQQGFIDAARFEKLGEHMGKSSYGSYLRGLLRQASPQPKRVVYDHQLD